MKTIALMLLGLMAIIKVFDPKTLFEQKTKINFTVQEKSFIPYLEKQGLRFPVIVAAQVFHETDQLRSPIYNSCNNLFGMKFNDRGYATGVCRGHAEYASKKASLLDYKAWQEEYLLYYEKKVLRKSCMTEEEYYKYLLWIGYAEDEKYIGKIKVWVSIIHELFPSTNSPL